MPDLDKLVRAVGDSLQAARLLKDDARIVRLGTCEKWEVNDGSRPGATIKITRLVGPS
jgi:Holliday junction resolvase RusA-like endonuclease